MNSRILYTPREERFRRKRRTRRLPVFIGLFLIAAAAGTAVYLLRLPYWQVKRIEVIGNQTISAEELRLAAQESLRGAKFFIIPQNAIFALEPEKLASALASGFPRIAEIKIDKVFPDSLTLTLREREFFGIYCNDLNAATSTFAGEPACAYLDQSGFAYERAPQVSGFLIIKVSTDRGVIQIPSHLIEPEIMERMRKIADAFAANSGMAIVGYNLFSKVPSEIRAVTREGFEIWLKSDDDFEKAALIFKKVLEGEIKEQRPLLKYVDLRLGNKVFYKVRK